MLTYQDVSGFAQTWGLVILVIFFTVAIAYALWPTNKKKFERAAQLPLSNGELSED